MRAHLTKAGRVGVFDLEPVLSSWRVSKDEPCGFFGACLIMTALLKNGTRLARPGAAWEPASGVQGRRKSGYTSSDLGGVRPPGVEAVG